MGNNGLVKPQVGRWKDCVMELQQGGLYKEEMGYELTSFGKIQ